MKITEKTPRISSSGEWHLRIFAVAQKPLDRGQWRAHDVCSPFWRFYANDRDGMEMELLDAPHETAHFALGMGRFYFVPPGVRFSGQTRELVRHFYIHFDVLGAPPLLFPTFQSHLARPFEIPDFSASEAAQKLARQVATNDIVSDDEAPDAPTALRAKSLLFEAFAACIERWPAEPDANLEWVRPALEHIEAHLAEPPTNAKLAALCHLSSDYFIVRFRCSIGQTPGQYLLERRLAVAAQKLVFSGESIESIAAQTGFCDRFHLSRAFKTRFGLSPAAYRKSRTA